MSQTNRSSATAGSFASVPRREAARHLFEEHLGTLSEQAGMWRVRPDEQHLHQLRIALRRVRVLLRVFEKDTDQHGGKRLRSSLTRIADKLGAVRDMDVLLALVHKSDFRRCGRNDIEVDRLVSAMKQVQQQYLRVVNRTMTAATWTNIDQTGRRFLDRLGVESVRAKRETIKKFLDREYLRHCRRIMNNSDDAESQDADVLHSFRISLRRLRYLGDLLDDIASTEQRKVFKLAHRCEEELGRVHDLDLAMEFLDRHPMKSPVQLRQEWLEKRQIRLKRFRKKWRKCREKME